MLIRLNKFLADAGLFSRREADEHILAGEITVNGNPVTEMGTKIEPDHDIVEYKGKIIKLQTAYTYYALYKPKGVVSTAKDELGRQTVLDFVPKEPRVYPVGRLDADSEGLIILTNDGDLTNHLTHPSFEHEKEYEIIVKSTKQKAKSPEEITKMFENGFMIDGHLMIADVARSIKSPALSFPLSAFSLVLHTGYNRQIRRMCDKIGLNVIKLTRTRIGKLKLADLNLKHGGYMEITKSRIV
ncbi:MAG: pseudouridine synthase [Patescibacteria group bacterium]